MSFMYQIIHAKDLHSTKHEQVYWIVKHWLNSQYTLQACESLLIYITN